MRALAVVTLYVLAASACHTSPVPIAAPTAFEFRPELLGLWQSLDDETPDTLFVLGFNPAEYYVELHTQLEGPLIWRGRAFITRVAGTDFMNVQELGLKPTGYIFYRFAVQGDTATVAALKSGSRTFETSADVRGFITENLASDTMYEEADRYVRLKVEDE
jgi:hypothetical protein